MASKKVKLALKLLDYIERVNENGVDIRRIGIQWMIGDHWNEIIEGIGCDLLEAIDDLPRHGE